MYDHSIILRDIDPLVDAFKSVAPESKLNVVHDSPTAEWMAKCYYNDIKQGCTMVDLGLKVVSVSVQETEKNIATYSEV